MSERALADGALQFPDRQTYTRRQVLRIAALGATTIGLQACGVANSGSGGADQSAGEGGGEVDVVGAATSMSIMTDLDYAGVPGGMAEYWATLVDRFQTAHEVQVDANNVPFEDMFSRIQAAHSSRTGPVLVPWYANFHTFQFVHQDALEPLAEWVGGQEEIDQWRFASRPFDGNHYHCPLFMELIMLVANRTHLEQAGVAHDQRFESWDHIVEAFEAVKASGNIPIMLGVADGFMAEMWILASVMEVMEDPIQWSEWLAGKRPITDPTASLWVDRLEELRDKQLINHDAPDITKQEAVERFSDGEGAFMMSQAGEALALDPEVFAIIPFWKGTGPASAQLCAAGTGMIMTSYGDNKEAAGNLLRFMHQPDQLTMFRDVTHELPADSRYQPPSANVLANTAYQLLDSEPAPYWPTEYMPSDIALNGLYVFAPKLVSGATGDTIRTEFDDYLIDWRTNNPEVLRVLEDFIDTVQA